MLVADQPVVVPDRHRQVEQRLQQAVERRRLPEVGAADDVGDALGGVVDDHREVVGGADVLAAEHHVADAPRASAAGSRACSPGVRGAGLVEAERAPRGRRGVDRGGEVEAHGVAVGLRRSPAAAGAGIDGGRGAPSCGAASAARDVGAGAAAGIGEAERAPAGRARRRSAARCSDWRSTGSGQARPSQARSSQIAASNSGRQRVASMSSMRSRKVPPAPRARSQAVSAEKAWPRCRRPGRRRREAGAQACRRAVSRRGAARAALLARLVDQDPGEQDEHRVGEPAREDDRRDPDRGR